ncbi:hypothetical protein ARMGADRAFT_481398 [Armillaria gallica]|uniref:Uncharacterized protein n=1 Tax=Armillaria gallica TaxID=47427 RepID=A0A2H3D7M3_ARMGA|nr:hypothetical protein ARMGADRAFT_481398 [Armillaria gallica]
MLALYLRKRSLDVHCPRTRVLHFYILAQYCMLFSTLEVVRTSESSCCGEEEYHARVLTVYWARPFNIQTRWIYQRTEFNSVIE